MDYHNYGMELLKARFFSTSHISICESIKCVLIAPPQLAIDQLRA